MVYRGQAQLYWRTEGGTYLDWGREGQIETEGERTFILRKEETL